MLSAHVHVICLSSLILLIYPIFHNLVSIHIVSTYAHCQYHVYCLQMHMLCTSHFYCCYLHMYMSSGYYLSICILCVHYLQWSLIYSFLTDNADVIHMSSLVLFIYPIMYNLVSTHCLHRCTLSMSFACCHTCTHHLIVIFTTLHIPYYPEPSFRTLSTHMHIVYVISIPFRNAHFMYMPSLLLLSVCVHVIYILSWHICIMCTLYEVVLDIFLPNRQYQCHPYIISSTLYIFYYVQLSFCTLSAQMHLVHVICMLSAHVHIICLSSLYLIIQNLVSAHCLHTCILSMPSVYCLEMHKLCTCHLYCCYLYVYMSSTYYLGIYVLCTHYLKWSLISSFLTDNTNVIHTSSLVVFIYSIMENMLSTPLPDDMSSTPLPDDMSSAPLPDDMSSAPLPDDMSSAFQRNMSYLFEV